MLSRLLTKYGMKVEDLENEAQPVTRREFKYGTEYERKLLIQIVANVLGTREISVWKPRGRKARYVDLTALQYAEVDVRYTAMRVALRKELDKAAGRVYSAFIHTNNLGVAASDDEGPGMDMDELAAIMALMQTMRPTPIRRQIAA